MRSLTLDMMESDAQSEQEHVIERLGLDFEEELRINLPLTRDMEIKKLAEMKQAVIEEAEKEDDEELGDQDIVEQ